MPAAETLLERLYGLLEKHPLFAALVLLAVQTGFTLNARALWYSDEIRHANAYEHLRDAGKWVVLHLNGQPYPDKPPVYFWLLRLLDALPSVDEPAVFFLGAAVSAGLLVAASWWLLRTTLGRSPGVLAGLLVMLSSLFFLLITHYSRMDLLFAALIIASQTALFRAWTAGAPGRWAVGGLALAGLAVLTKGPLGLAFPVVTSAAFLLWRGELRKLASRGVLLGLAACLGLLAAWLAAALMVEGPAFMHDIFVDQVYRRAVDSWHHKEPFQYYFVALPPAFLPWTLLVFVAPWRRLLQGAFWANLWGTRRQAGGRAYLWVLALVGFALLTSLSIKVLVYILPLLPPLAGLAGGLLCNLEGRRAGGFAAFVGGYYLLLAAAAPFTETALPYDIPLRGLGFTTLILGGLGLWLAARRPRPRVLLTGVVLASTLWVIPAALLTAPSFDPVMSPKAQARVMADFAEQGYAPTACRIYSGLYSYYAGRNVTELDSLAQLQSFRDQHRLVVTGMPRKYWRRWRDRLPGMRKVHEQRIADKVYVLAITKDGAPGGSTGPGSSGS
jgi:4-amino-4-deoxy-L-arabinose transferase-like glycosyltransferase